MRAFLNRRLRLSLLMVALAGLLAFATLPALAAPPRCEDGSPPPCEGDDPPPPTTRPAPTSTTRPTSTTIPRPIPTPPPTTTPPPPPPPATWKINVLQLSQDDGGLTGPINAERFWMYEPVNHPGNFFVNPPDTTIGRTPAGTSGLVNGQFVFPDQPLPAGQKMILRVTESGSPGVLCRTPPRGQLPISGVPLHLLIAPPVTMTATELQEMAAGFVGPVTSGLPAGVTMNITTANLTPQADGLMLQLLGTLTVGEFDYTFDYHLPLKLQPSTGDDVAYVLYVQATGPGTVDLVSVGEPNGDHIIDLIKAELLPKMRSAVPVRGTPAVNDKVHLDHDVQWWRDQGFNISMRRVTYSAEAMTLYPSLCRLGW